MKKALNDAFNIKQFHQMSGWSWWADCLVKPKIAEKSLSNVSLGIARRTSSSLGTSILVFAKIYGTHFWLKQTKKERREKERKKEIRERERKKDIREKERKIEIREKERKKERKKEERKKERNKREREQWDGVKERFTFHEIKRERDNGIYGCQKKIPR